jgi:hypothetical protein
MLGVLGPVPLWITGVVFVVIFGWVIRAIIKFTKDDKEVK